MRTLSLVAVFALAAGLTARQPEPKAKTAPKAKTDQELLQGMWLVVGLESGGKVQPDKSYKGNAFIFTRDRVSLKEANYPPVDFTFSLDPTKTPKAIDLAGKNATVRGIYKLDGDDLTLCVGIGAAPRPGEFATKAGGEAEIFLLRRNRWERYTDKAGRYSVEMPGRPEERRREADAPGGKTTTFQVVRSQTERVSYLVAVTPLGVKPDAKQAETAIDAARAVVVAEVDAKAASAVDSDKEFRSEAKGAGAHAGRELTITLDPTDSKTRGAVRVRLFVSGDRAYSLAVAGPEDAVKAANVARFWSSFRLVPEKKN